MAHHKILILDFGSQVTQLIARRVREAHVYCEVHPCDVSDEWVRQYAADGQLKGVILSGSHASAYEDSTDRLPLRAMVHQETFEDYTAKRIDDFYRAKEALEVNKNFVEINRKETLAQVFTDIKYTKKDNEAMSKSLLEALHQQGFL